MQKIHKFYNRNAWLIKLKSLYEHAKVTELQTVISFQPFCNLTLKCCDFIIFLKLEIEFARETALLSAN